MSYMQWFRLKETALAVKIDKLHIGEVCDKSIKELVIWFQKLEKKLTKKKKKLHLEFLELNERILFLNNVGLEYLTLSRGSGSLSGGGATYSSASQIGSGLTGVLMC